MTKLSDTQLILLNHAAQRADLGIAAIDKRAVTKPAIEGLLKGKLLKTTARTPDLAIWTRDEDGQKLALMVTPKGLKAINMDGPPDVVPAPEAARAKSKPASKGKSSGGAAAKSETKLQALVKLLRRPKGATIADMMSATGWQAHSVRGAISGAIRKKLGLNVTSERTDNTRTYRTAA